MEWISVGNGLGIIRVMCVDYLLCKHIKATVNIMKNAVDLNWCIMRFIMIKFNNTQQLVNKDIMTVFSNI